MGKMVYLIIVYWQKLKQRHSHLPNVPVQKIVAQMPLPEPGQYAQMDCRLDLLYGQKRRFGRLLADCERPFPLLQTDTTIMPK